MDRSTFFARKPKTTTVDIENLGTVHIRKLTAAEFATVGRDYSEDANALDGFYYVVSRTVVDGDGKRVFDDDDQAKLADVEFDVIKRLAEASMAYSGASADPKAPSAG